MDRRNILIIVNLAIVILEIIGFALVFKELGTDAFIYYTEDSNLILLISSLVFLAYAFLKKDLQIFAIPSINANFATDFIRKLAVGYCPRLL